MADKAVGIPGLTFAVGYDEFLRLPAKYSGQGLSGLRLAKAEAQAPIQRCLAVGASMPLMCASGLCQALKHSG